MDLPLYGRVLRRFWGLVLMGLTLAIFFATLSVAHISSKGLSYRTDEVWESTTLLLLTRKGSPFAAPTSYSPLTDLYAQLANSDPVRRSMLKAGGKQNWNITATPIAPTFNPGAVLPVISLAGEAPTPLDAVRATVLGRQAFLNYVSRQKGSAGIEVLQNSTPPKLTVPRSKTLPIILFLALLSATIALAFILENVRPARAKAPAIGEADRDREPASGKAGRDQEPAVGLRSHSSR